MQPAVLLLPPWRISAQMRHKRLEPGLKDEREAEGFKLQLHRLPSGAYAVEAYKDGTMVFRKTYIMGQTARDTFRKWRPTWKGDA
jgi:hypothetical protein